jgi:alpha-galactosidase
MLDGSHPGAQAYLEHVFRTMRERWGCHYFKLDANTWGALHGGARHDALATRIEAYRRGMAAVRRGAGPESFLLGCNAPMWGSLGEVHGMRVSEDISRSWSRLCQVARQCFSRNWQHGRLWINDPDCLVLANKPGRPPLTDAEFRFHATAILATGGMLLDGDDTAALSPADWQHLRRLLPPSGKAARFRSAALDEGVIDLPDRRRYCLFNWGDSARPGRLTLPERCHVTDFWSGAHLGEHEGDWTAGTIPAHGALVLECGPLA